MPPIAELASVLIGPALIALTLTCLSGPSSAERSLTEASKAVSYTHLRAHET